MMLAAGTRHAPGLLQHQDVMVSRRSTCRSSAWPRRSRLCRIFVNDARVCGRHAAHTTRPASKQAASTAPGGGGRSTAPGPEAAVMLTFWVQRVKVELIFHRFSTSCHEFNDLLSCNSANDRAGEAEFRARCRRQRCDTILV